MSRQASKRKMRDSHTLLATAKMGAAEDTQQQEQLPRQPHNTSARKRFSARINCRAGDAADSTTAVAAAAAAAAAAAPTSASATKSTATNASKPPQQHRRNKPAAEMTEDEKREDRARRNRASALKSRNKRRQRLAYLEVEYKRLQGIVEKLQKQNDVLQNENATLRQQQQQQQQQQQSSTPQRQQQQQQQRQPTKQSPSPQSVTACTSPRRMAVAAAAAAAAAAADAPSVIIKHDDSTAALSKKAAELPALPLPLKANTAAGSLAPARIWRQSTADQFMCLLDDVAKAGTGAAGRTNTPLHFVDDIDMADFEAVLGGGGGAGADDWAGTGIDHTTLLCADWVAEIGRAHV